MRVLITGASGFAGSWLCRECAAGGDEVVALSRRGNAPDGAAAAVSLDLRDADALAAVVGDARPEAIYHLAALSSVGRSWERPAQTMEENVQGAVSLLEAIRHRAPEARVVWVSSCEVYGEPAALPIGEQARLAPASPYAVSKASAELLAAVYAQSFGLQVIRARPFSHAGPGQRPIFLLSSLARQAAAGQLAGDTELRIVTGNPNTRRDFTDVRDVARAYWLLALGAEPAVYNVSSGRSISAAEQVEILAELIAPVRVRHEVDPTRVRAHEVTELRGDHSLLTAATGWEPTISFRETMAETIGWWREQLSGGGG